MHFYEAWPGSSAPFPEGISDTGLHSKCLVKKMALNRYLKYAVFVVSPLFSSIDMKVLQ